MKTPQKCASGQTAAHKYCHLKLQTSSQILVFTAKNPFTMSPVKYPIIMLSVSFDSTKKSSGITEEL
jgi:hypothetical protein